MFVVFDDFSFFRETIIVTCHFVIRNRKSPKKMFLPKLTLPPSPGSSVYFIERAINVRRYSNPTTPRIFKYKPWSAQHVSINYERVNAFYY